MAGGWWSSFQTDDPYIDAPIEKAVNQAFDETRFPNSAGTVRPTLAVDYKYDHLYADN